MNLFYCPDIELSPILSESESLHCCRVLRMKEGDIIEVADGKGYRYMCRIVSANPKKTQVEIVSRHELARHHNYNVTLAIAPTKNIDRTEWAIEKAIEFGVDRIVLLKCAHSERKDVKTDRLMKVMVAALKQSLSPVMPELSELISIKDFIRNAPTGQKFIAYCGEKDEKLLMSKLVSPGQNVTVMIGPEGDFSPDEVEMAIEHGFRPVSLGESRLRTETAAIFAMAAIETINQRN